MNVVLIQYSFAIGRQRITHSTDSELESAKSYDFAPSLPFKSTPFPSRPPGPSPPTSSDVAPDFPVFRQS